MKAATSSVRQTQRCRVHHNEACCCEFGCGQLAMLHFVLSGGLPIKTKLSLPIIVHQTQVMYSSTIHQHLCLCLPASQHQQTLSTEARVVCPNRCLQPHQQVLSIAGLALETFVLVGLAL